MVKARFILILLICIISSTVFAQTDTLHIYESGGPFSAIGECATSFTERTGIPVKIFAGRDSRWSAREQKGADVIFEGAEYMLTQFNENHPGIIDSTSIEALYKRRVAILVRPGNPKRIKSLKDLTRQGIRILDVNGAGQLGFWEDLAGKTNLIEDIRHNITGSFPNTALCISAWRTDSSYDAWITYASWHNALRDLTGIVFLPHSATLYRGNPIALTLASHLQTEGKLFILFMKSELGHKIFRKWGWE